MNLLAGSIAAIALAASPALAQNQPPTDNTTQATTTSTHHVRTTTKTTHGSMHRAAHHRTRHHSMRCGCPTRHYAMKSHHKVVHKTETTTKTPG